MAIRDWIWRWDPAGLSGERGDFSSEYDDLAAGLAWRASGALSADRAVDWLRGELETIWGVSAALLVDDREELLRLLAAA